MEISIIPIAESGHDEKYVIFRPLTGLAFVGNKAMADLALSLAGSPQNEAPGTGPGQFLQACGFFEPDPPCFDIANAAYSPVMAVILLTNQCQLQCTYCYAAAGSSRPQYLSGEYGRAVIDYVAKTAQEGGQPSFEVAFHGGGEPTFPWHLFKELVHYAREQPLTARISLTSNGIWSEEQCAWVIANLDELTISMDGSPETQNRQRPLASGGGSSALVMQVLKQLDQSDLRYGIRMTAMDPWHNLPHDVSYIFEGTACRSIQVEPAFNVKRGGHPLPNTREAHGFTDGFVAAYQVARQAGVDLRYSGVKLDLASNVFCRAPFMALIANLEGHLVSCYEVTDDQHPLAGISTFGRIEDGQIRIDFQARDRLMSLLAERRASCRDCFLYWSCAGDCYARVFRPGERGHLVHGPRCEMNRAIFKEVLLMEIAQTSGVWRRHALHQPVANRLRAQ